MFLAPLFLIGLLATAIPLVLHLRRSTRHKKIVFSTTRFFDEQFIRSARRAQVQDKLLMLLRIALLALFVLALAQPLVHFRGFRGFRGLAALTGGRRNVAIVLDDSASMSVADARGPLLDRAKAAAVALLDGLSPRGGDRATLVLAGRREGGPRVMFPAPTGDFDAVRREIEAVRATDLATDLNAAVARAGQALGADPAKPPGEAGAASGTGAAGGSREVFVFSDLQESALSPGATLTPGPGATLTLVATRAEDNAARGNVSVDAIQYGSPQPMQNVPFTFRALLTNHAERPQRATATLVVNGQPVSQKPVELPAGRGKVVRFTHRFTSPGWFRGDVELSPASAAEGAPEVGWSDAVAADNRRYFALRVEDRVKLLAVDGAPSAVPIQDELFFFRLALSVDAAAANPAAGLAPPGQPVAGAATPQAAPVSVEQISPRELTPERLAGFPLAVLANVPDLAPEALEALERFVDAGGNLLITLGDRVTPKAYDAWVGENRLHGGLLPGRLTGLVGNSSAAAPREGPGAAAGGPADAGTIATVADDHPAVAGFAGGEAGNLAAVRFTARYRFDASPDEVLMRDAAGDPLLAEKRFGRGRVVLFASSIDRDWSNFPLQSAYVPWLYRLVGYLAQGGIEGAGFVRTGQVVSLPASATQVEALQIDLPDGGVAYPEPSQERGGGASGNAPGLALSATEQAGVYALRAATQAAGGSGGDAAPRALFAANIPSEESAPGYLDKAGIEPLIAAEARDRWDYVDASAGPVDASRLSRGGTALWDELLFIALLVGLFEPWLANRLSKRRGAAAADALAQRDAVAAPRSPTLDAAA